MDNTTSADDFEFFAFMNAEKICIEKDKWFKGIQIHKDPGDDFIFDWVQYNSQEFRDKWELSQCKHCVSAFCCGHYLKTKCNNFEKRKEKNNG